VAGGPGGGPGAGAGRAAAAARRDVFGYRLRDSGKVTRLLREGGAEVNLARLRVGASLPVAAAPQARAR